VNRGEESKKMVKPSELERDKFYKRAKEKGYRSRSAFKLLAMQKRFKLIQRGDVVVDLGAAPGGWSQVASRIVGNEGIVVSVDLQHISPRGISSTAKVRVVRSDIRDVASTVSAVREQLERFEGEKRLADVILSDASPNLSGNKSYDHYLSFLLSVSALKIAVELLREGGNFVAKIFQGEDFQHFYKMVKQHFAFAKPFTPEATRKHSSEVYVVGKHFKGRREFADDIHDAP